MGPQPVVLERCRQCVHIRELYAQVAGYAPSLPKPDLISGVPATCPGDDSELAGLF